MNNTEDQLEIAFKFDQQKQNRPKKSISRFKPTIEKLVNETIQKKEEELKTTNNDDDDNDIINKQNSNENEIKEASAIQMKLIHQKLVGQNSQSVVMHLK